VLAANSGADYAVSIGHNPPIHFVSSMNILPQTIATLAACAIAGGLARAESIGGGLVERVAGWTSADYRRDRARLGEIDRELVTLPGLVPRPLAWRYGFRGKTILDSENPHWLQIDLGSPQRIDRIVAMPAHIPPLGKQGEGYGFPIRFRIEVSDDPHMRDAVTVVDQTAADFPNPGRYPADFRIAPMDGRYVRFTSTKHFPIDEGFIWALEELVVLSGNRSVAALRTASSSNSLEMFPNWSVNRVQDGQSALGLPVAVEPSPSHGYLSALTEDHYEPKWLDIDLGGDHAIDEIRLVPVQPGGYEALGERAFPRTWSLELAEDPGFERIAWREKNGPTNLVGYPGDCALIVPCNGKRGRYLRFTALQLWGGANRYGFGLAEIQAYSGNQNVALGKPVTASDPHDSESGGLPADVTDGFSSRHRLIEIPEYLERIARRGILEKERAKLVIRHDRHLHVTGLVLGYSGGAIGTAGVLGFLWMLARQQHIRRQSIAALREQIARDLHDDIGSNLGGILLLSEIGSQDSIDPKSRQDFQIIKEAAEGASESMGDILWLIQRGGSGLRELVARMRQSARMILGDQELVLDIDPPDFKDRRLSLIFRRHLFFAFKETLNNIRKHARAQKIVLRIRMDGWHFTFTVEDDGVGFDTQAAIREGSGLGNLKRRAARLKGTCHIESTPGRGSIVTFSAPFRS
jgi:signal transduction histidine kinase